LNQDGSGEETAENKRKGRSKGQKKKDYRKGNLFTEC
jgi:hypothetical protein